MRDRRLTKLFGVGDAVPDDPGAHVDVIFDEAIADGIVYASVRAGADNLILEWQDGAVWTVARGAWLAAPNHAAPTVQTTFSADGGAVAFATGLGTDGDVWLAEGCSIERVVSTGDGVGGSTIQSLSVPTARGLVGRFVDIQARLADGRDVHPRARPRTA
jgi:hypothetical protein